MNCFISSGFDLAIEPGGLMRISYGANGNSARAENLGGPPNHANARFSSVYLPVPGLLSGGNTFAKASATPPPGSIPAFTATRNIRLVGVIAVFAPPGFGKPFAIVEYRYN